jgi:hypothetical protein
MTVKKLSDDKIRYSKKGLLIPYLNSYASGAKAVQLDLFTDEGDFAGTDIITIDPAIHGISNDDPDKIFIMKKHKQYAEALADAKIITIDDKYEIHEADTESFSYFTAVLKNEK